MAAREFTFEDAKNILVNRIGVPEDTVNDPSQSFEDLGLDSLAFVEIQLAMQQEYGFQIPDEDAEQITTIGEAIDYTNKQAERGGIVMAGHTDNSVVIDKPIDEVWQRMNDLENWTNLFTEYASVEILERDGNTVKFRLTTHPDPEYDGQVWSWTSERTMDPDSYTTKSHRIETGPFEYMNIEWYFEPADGGTKMRWVQDFSMKESAPANDEQAEEYLNKNTTEQMKAIKERLESG